MPRWLPNLLALVITLGTPPFLVLSNLFVFLTPQYLNFEYSKPDFPQADLFSPRDRYYYASESIEYERGTRTFEQFQGLGVYTDRELNHMVDVRVLIAQVGVFHAMDGLLLLVLLVTLVVQPVLRLHAARAVFNGALLTVGLFALLGLFAGVAFDTFFVYFHRAFFQGDSWLFYYTDSLIQFYPVRFWNDTALYLVGATILEALILGVVGWFWVRKAFVAREPGPASAPTGLPAQRG